jgi:poly(3-hydroxybutyrate) depolymerase
VKRGMIFLLGMACWSWGGGWAGEALEEADQKQQIAELERQIAAVEEKRPAGPDEVFDSNLPLAKLQVEKLRQRLQDPWRGVSWGKAWREDVAAAQAALQRLAEGRVAFADGPAPGDRPYLERAYESQTDGSPQPYFVGVPEDYTPERAWPLVVFLHGYVPDTSFTNPWVVSEEKWELAKKAGVLFVLPHGRRNSDFLGVGEVDTLAVIREMQRYYHVDPNRIYLMGASMGGYGCWAIALHYPDLFAAICPISGQTDFFLWENRDRRRAPLFKAVLTQWNNPVDLAENALNLPSFCQHGGHDNLVPTIHSQLMTARLRVTELEPFLPPADIERARALLREAGLPELNYHHRYFQDDRYGHYIYWDLPCYQRPLHWINTGSVDLTDEGKGPLVRDPAPPHVIYRTYNLKYHRAYWVQIDEFGQWAQRAQIEARVQPDNRIEVVTENVTRFTLDLPDSLLDRTQPITVVTNGEVSYQGPAPPEGRIRVALEGALPPPQPGELRKTPALCGPAREAFNTPFLVTYGTIGARAPELKKNAERFVQEWYDFAEGRPPLKSDREVTAEDRRKYNLVCFGEPESHALLAPLAARLPLGIQPYRYRVGNEEFAGEDVGLVLLYPNPEQPDRLLLIFSGLYWGTPLPINHKFDLLPDFIVFNSQVLKDGRDPINQHLIAGFFNQQWQLDPALIDRGPRL